MKINSSNNKGSVQKSSGPGNAGAAKKTDKAGSSQSESVTKAGVSVSGAEQVSASQGSAAQLRADRVANVKLAVEDGSYRDDSRATATKIVQNLTDYSLA